ncbi:MAG TPA: V-type ATPase 116kDa subunit family protein [bacterium]|nr:V-type ATPase 116kDa subunit family protein [bacterium]
MIVEMSRVTVLGPKRLLGQVIDEVQRLGSLHVERIESEELAQVSRAQLTPEESQALQILERSIGRVEGILTLLPPGPSEQMVTGEMPDSTSTEALDAWVADLEPRVRDLTRRRLELEEERTLIASFEGAVRVLSPLLSALAGSRSFETIGFILNTKDLTPVAALRNELASVTENRVEVVSRTVDENRIGVVVAFRKADSDRVRSVLARAGAVELRLPGRFAQGNAADTIALMERRKAEIPREIEQVDAELLDINQRERPRLMAVRASMADTLAQKKIVGDMAQSHYAFVLHGWAPTRTLDEIRARLGARFGKDVVVYDQPADPHHYPERVPVLLDNHPLIRPFQRLLALFLPPRYGAWDPSPVLAITFPIFVGLVIGDVAYGMLLFWLGWKFRTMARAGKALTINFLNVRFPPDLLADLSFLIRISAFWMIVFGVIYLEFFGNLPELLAHKYHLPIHPIYNRVAEAQTSYFQLIIAAGIVMIFFGLIIHFVQALRHRHFVGVFEAIVITLGTAGLFLFLGASGDKLPSVLGPIGLYLFLGAVAVAVISLVVDRDVMKRLLWLLESTSAFGHILSHARLLAFGLAAAALATAANEVGPAMSQQFGVPGFVGRIFGWILAAVFQTMFFVFTIMGHVIQPARLHWVEFFTKFKYHEETGRAYRPFQKTSAP